MSDLGYGVVVWGVVMMIGFAAVVMRNRTFMWLMLTRWFEELARAIEAMCAALAVFLKVVTGGTIDLVDFIGHSDRSHPVTANPKPQEHEIAFRGYERFEANTDCPTCGAIAVHRMREPREASKYKQRLMTIELGLQHAKRYDELVYEVIRICAQCGQEWGQR